MAGVLPFGVDEKRPAVRILLLKPVPDEIMTPILLGLEEEGIPVEPREAPGGSAEALAKQAADGSPLNVGIGINPAEQEVVLHHRDLPVGKALFSLGAAELQPLRLRQLGLNAARLVKGDPLVFQDMAVLPAARHDPGEPVHREAVDLGHQEMETLESLIIRVVQELLTEE